ncbi:MAG: hypothetical protein E3J47_08165 [Candidatus Stahlbacteria bacterium]|nr:MAG: hypothetical protein E3J47_08165 [Candidatus Stahlbacteria bacterium]
MLFPGAIIIVIIITVIVGGCFSIAIGCIGGVIVYRLSELIIHNTKLHKRMTRGEKVDDRSWWIDHRQWFCYGLILSTCIIAYTIAGPLWAFVEWLK